MLVNWPKEALLLKFVKKTALEKKNLLKNPYNAVVARIVL